MPNTIRLPRGKRSPRTAAANAQAINNIISGSKRNVGPALGKAVKAAAKAAAAIAGPSRAGPSRMARPRPSGGIGVKKMGRFRKRNKRLSIEKTIASSESCSS